MQQDTTLCTEEGLYVGRRVLLQALKLVGGWCVFVMADCRRLDHYVCLWVAKFDLVFDLLLDRAGGMMLQHFRVGVNRLDPRACLRLPMRM